MTDLARTSHEGRPGAPKIALLRQHISDLIVIPLNDEVVEGAETAEAWPPQEGLPPGEDPFDEKGMLPAPDFLPPGAVVQQDSRRISVERAFAISVILHLLLVIALLTVKLPARTAAQDNMDPLGIQSLMSVAPPDPAIPIQFFPAPGARVKDAPKTALPSDMNRQAHGGDRALPVLPMPKAYPQAGIRDLEAGKQGPKIAAAPAAQPPAGSPAGERAKLTDLARGGALHDPPTAEERARQRLLGIPGPDLSAITAEAARKAAQAGGGGEEGGGYEKEGGFVDSGPLSFDTVGYDWGAYAAEMIRKIKRNWDVPALARYGMKGRITIRFYILKDGRVEGETILSSSGKPPFDNSSYQAIARSSPFRPLPADLGHDREGVTVTFFYNMRPEDEYAGR
ncbi:MAG: energy transducer TonB [Acidobacteriota bacterium]